MASPKKSTAAQAVTPKAGPEQVGPTPGTSLGERIVSQNKGMTRWMKQPLNAIEQLDHSKRPKSIPIQDKYEVPPAGHDNPAMWSGKNDDGELYPEAIRAAIDLNSGRVVPQQLFRSYKSTPHQPAAVFLKYLVHRHNHQEEYDDPATGHQLDQDFLKLVQSGEAARRNGHLSAADLHDWSLKNHKVVEQVLAHRDAVQQDILKGVGLNVRDIHGVPHVALTRGLNSDIMTKEHALSSWADIPDTGFGDKMHHAWVPVKDVWFGFPHFHHDYSSDNHENEYLVSHTAPKYEARYEDVRASRIKNGRWWHGPQQKDPQGEGSKSPWDLGLRARRVAPYTDSATDQDLARFVSETGGSTGSIPDFLLDHKNAGPLTRQALAKAYGNGGGDWVAKNGGGIYTGPQFRHLAMNITSREDALRYLTPEQVKWSQWDRGTLEAVKNPHLTHGDLEQVIQHMAPGGGSVASGNILRHPSADSRTAEQLWERTKDVPEAAGAKESLAESHLTPPHVLDEMVQQLASITSDKGHGRGLLYRLAGNPNLTTAQGDKLWDWANRPGPREMPLGVSLPDLTTKHRIAEAAPLSVSSVEKMAEGSPFIENFIKSNPHANEDTLRVLTDLADSDERRAKYIVPAMLEREEKFGLPPGVQNWIVRQHLNASDSLVSRGFQNFEASKHLSPETVAALATHPSYPVRAGLFWNQSLTGAQLRAALPAGQTTDVPARGHFDYSLPFEHLAGTIREREAFEERRKREHLIRPYPATLAKSEAGDSAMWQAEVHDWLSKVNTQEPGYLIPMPEADAYKACLQKQLMPTWNREVLEGQAVTAWGAKQHHQQNIEGALQPGNVLVHFNTEQKPKRLADGRFYWTEPVQMKDAKLISAGKQELQKAQYHQAELDELERQLAPYYPGAEAKEMATKLAPFKLKPVGYSEYTEWKSPPPPPPTEPGTWGGDEEEMRPRDPRGNPAFDAWFQGSKAIHPSGQPLVAFHGTHKDFNEFGGYVPEPPRPGRYRPDRSGASSDQPWAGPLGSWFTAQPKLRGNYDPGNAEATAASFPEHNGSKLMDGEPVGDWLNQYKEGARVIPVHLSIKNPAEFDGHDDLLDTARPHKTWKAFRHHLEQAGHDGVIIRNSMTDGDADRDDWVAFHPHQIKSAIGNAGTYDPNEAHIAKGELPAWRGEHHPVSTVFAGYEPGGRISKVQYVHPLQLEPTEDKLDETKVASLERQLRTDPDKVPPLIAGADGLFVIDGHHRLAAAHRVGHSRIPIRTYLDSSDAGMSLRVPTLGKSEDGLSTGLNLLAPGLEDWEEEVALRMLGHDPRVNTALAAARFLTGGKQEPDMEKFGLAMRIFGEVEKAALYAYKIPDSEKNLKALRATIKLGGRDLAKGEAEQAPTIKSVEAGEPASVDAAEAVARAFQAGLVQRLHLNGRHSSGALAARDPQSKYVYLLKPGSGKLSPASGVSQEKASQSRREVGFWKVADIFGLGQTVPRADLLIVDGDKEWAAIRLLDGSFRPLDEKNREKENYAAEVLKPYLENTLLHRWALLDATCGNTDSHGQNMLVNDGGSCALIDHGSAFAGTEFDPAHDKNSFIPFYLRCWGPLGFMKLSPEERLRYMPRLGRHQDTELKDWLAGLDPAKVQMVLAHLGIDPAPTLARLKFFRDVPGNLSDAVNRFWARAVDDGPLRKNEDAWSLSKSTKPPYDPVRDTSSQERYRISQWQNHADHVQRELIPRLEGAGRQRALSKLHSKTEVRRNPQTGQREFLLHRATNSNDPKKKVTSWTSNQTVAEEFGSGDRDVSSVWTPEQHIHHVLSQVGAVGDAAAMRWHGTAAKRGVLAKMPDGSVRTMGKPGYLEDEVLVADPARPDTIADCPACKGTGKLAEDPKYNCDKCDGEGKLWPVQKSELLEKMSLTSIPVGEKVSRPRDEFDEEDQPTRPQTFDYSHLLDETARGLGYQLHVRAAKHFRGGRPARTGIEGNLMSPEGQHVGYVDGYAHAEPGFLDIEEGYLNAGERGKGLGSAAYEAVMAHAHNHLGCTHIRGKYHSTEAGRVHAKLAQRHGMDYSPVPNPEPTVNHQRLQMQGVTASDGKYGDYEYALKNELKPS